MSVAEPRSVPEHAAPWPMVAAYGEIHRYVGDELIATWKLADGIADAHCVRACFDALERLAALSPVYVRDVGTPVHCRAGLHCGPVVTGEIGSVKKEIVFLGDTVNTTARIQEFCRQTGDSVLASAALINLLELPFGITSARSETCTFAVRKVMLCFTRWRKNAPITQRLPRDSRPDAIFAR